MCCITKRKIRTLFRPLEIILESDVPKNKNWECASDFWTADHLDELHNTVFYNEWLQFWNEASRFRTMKIEKIYTISKTAGVATFIEVFIKENSYLADEKWNNDYETDKDW